MAIDNGIGNMDNGSSVQLRSVLQTCVCRIMDRLTWWRVHLLNGNLTERSDSEYGEKARQGEPCVQFRE